MKYKPILNLQTSRATVCKLNVSECYYTRFFSDEKIFQEQKLNPDNDRWLCPGPTVDDYQIHVICDGDGNCEQQWPCDGDRHLTGSQGQCQHLDRDTAQDGNIFNLEVTRRSYTCI